MSAQSARYSTVAIILHWLISLLIIGQLLGGLIMTRFLPKASALTFEIYQLHKSFGITVLLLSVLRLLWRLGHRPPELPADMANWERVSARITHILFYALILLIPLSGWAMVSSSPLNIPTYLFDVIKLPHLPFWEDATNKAAITSRFATIHEYMGFFTIALLALHVGAALKHHFVNKDSVLTRMLPIVRPRSAR